MSEINYMTQDGFDKLKAEIEHLTMVERKRISGEIGEARDKGDLSENAEYDAAKEAQGLLELKISKLQTLFGNSRVLDTSKMASDKVAILCNVRLINKKINKEVKYSIVSEKEANFREGKLSAKSPIGSALIGHKVGETIDVRVPAGVIPFEILEISY
jgi:transcription elongation factor GreA